MKKLLFIIALLISIMGFKSEDKIQLPINEKTEKIEYVTVLNFENLKKNEIYDKFIKWAYSNYSDKEIREHNKDDGIISLVGRTTYLYRGNELQLGFKLVFLVNDTYCKVVITNFNMKHKNLELFYNDYKDGPSRGPGFIKLHATFESIDSSVLKLISTIKSVE